MATIDLQKAVDNILKNQYFPEINKILKDEVPKVAKEAAKKLRAESPRRTGKYKRGWTSQVNEKRLEVTATVYGRSGTYQLQHLLEYGHAKRNGGRVAPEVHIKPVEEWAIEELETKVSQRIERA